MAANHVISSGTKVGRMISSSNADEIKDAVTRLRAVLVKAGFNEAEADAQVKAFGEKCGYDYDDMPAADMMPYQQYGGATSFAELDAYDTAADQSEAVMKVSSQFQALFNNIMSADLTPQERAAAVKVASADFETRLADKLAEEAAEGQKADRKYPESAYERTVRTYVDDPSIAHLRAKRDVYKNDPRAIPGPKGGVFTKPEELGAAARTWQPDAFKDPKNPPNEGKVAGAGDAKGGDDGGQPRDEHGRWTHKQRAAAVVAFKAGNPEALIQYFNDGADGRIDWGESGAFADCVDIASDHMDEDQAKGFCNLRHKDATGKYPGEKKELTSDAVGAFHAFKDSDGKWRFIATWSNNFKDLDGEVFPESAHKEFERHVDRTKEYPELWLWHVRGSKSGVTDMIAYDDGFCLATGTFDEDKGDIAEGLSRAKNLGVSHGYTYDPADLVGGVYRRYRTFEISPLPAEKAANIGTAFTAWKEEPIMLTAQKKAWLEQTIGPERAKQIEENTRRTKQQLEARGVSFKEFIEALKEGDDETPPAADAQASASADAATGAASAASGSPPSTGEPADGDKAGADAPPPTTAVEGMKELLDGFKSFKDEVAEWQKSTDAKLEALKASDDEKIASAWQASSRAPQTLAGHAASTSDGSLVDADKAKGALAALGLDTLGKGDDPAAPYVDDLMKVIGRVPVTT